MKIININNITIELDSVYFKLSDTYIPLIRFKDNLLNKQILEIKLSIQNLVSLLQDICDFINLNYYEMNFHTNIISNNYLFYGFKFLLSDYDSMIIFEYDYTNNNYIERLKIDFINDEYSIFDFIVDLYNEYIFYNNEIDIELPDLIY